jgi:type III secretion protein C
MSQLFHWARSAVSRCGVGIPRRATGASGDFLRYAPVIVLLCVASGAAYAARIPFPNEKVSYQLQAEPLKDFLKRFFDDLGIAVSISEAVQEESGTLNGPREGDAAAVFKKIADSNGLVGYYDGSVAFIYKTRELSSRYYQIDPARVEAFRQASVGFGLTDKDDTVHIRADTGLVSASGTPRFLDQLTQLSTALGRRVRTSVSEPISQRITLRFIPLKYAWAADTTFSAGGQRTVIPGVATIMRELVAQPNALGGLGETTPASPTVRGLRGRGLASLSDRLGQLTGQYGQSGSGMGQAPVNGAASSGSSGGTAPAEASGTNGSATAPPPNALSAFTASLEGGESPRIVADPYRNAIIIRDYPDRIPMYEDLVRQLDVESQIIELDATVIDIDKNNARQLGVDWTYQHGNTGAAFGGGIHPIDATGALSGLQINSIISNASNFMARVNALEQEGVTNIVQRPQVVTLNDVEAVIESTQTIYFPVSGAFDEDLYNVVAGTVLRVTPHMIVDNGRQRIRLLVEIDDGTVQVSNQPTVNANGQQLQLAVPSVVNNAVNTQAIIDAGEGLLLGGLVRHENTRSTNKIPLLGSIPLLGHLFRGDTVTKDHTERLFLISPQIVTASAQTLPQSAKP